MNASQTGQSVATLSIALSFLLLMGCDKSADLEIQSPDPWPQDYRLQFEVNAWTGDTSLAGSSYYDQLMSFRSKDTVRIITEFYDPVYSVNKENKSYQIDKNQNTSNYPHRVLFSDQSTPGFFTADFDTLVIDQRSFDGPFRLFVRSN